MSNNIKSTEVHLVHGSLWNPGSYLVVFATRELQNKYQCYNVLKDLHVVLPNFRLFSHIEDSVTF